MKFSRFILLALFLLIPTTTLAQGVLIVERTTERIRLPRPIRPPHPWPHPPRPIERPAPTYAIDSLEIDTKIDGQVAQVQVSQTFVNESKQTLEVSFVFPLPYNGAIDQLTLMVNGKELSGKLLSADEARRKYEEIVRKNRDPALLEWVGTGMYKTSVFPVPAGEKRTVTLRYTQLCPVTDGLADLRIPLATAKYTSQPIKKLKIRTAITNKEKIGNIYSPTHDVKIKRPNDKTAIVEYSAKKTIPATDYRLLFNPSEGAEEGLSARVISYRPKGSEDGYFLMLLSPQIKTNAERIPKTILFVIDKSGSMSGKKVQQARSALKFVLRNLDEKDLFNIVAYDTTIQTFKPELQKVDEKTRAEALGFVETIYAGGGTNINEALKTGMEFLKDKERPTYVVFLTDGLPTAGEQNEMKIVANCVNENKVGARLFPFGVGYDVNARLLDRLARKNHGVSEYVLPNQNIEEHISRLYRRIESPVLTGAKLTWGRKTTSEGESDKSPKVNRLYPKGQFDLFAGEQLVLVGRYHTPSKGMLTIKGQVGDEDKTYQFPFRFEEKSKNDNNAFVAKLWAVRRVGELIDELDLNGKNQELIDELVELATKHGIVTPYTSFLADETTDLHDKKKNRKLARQNLHLLESVAGESGVAQRYYKGKMQQANLPAMSGKALADSADKFAPATVPGSGRGGMGMWNGTNHMAGRLPKQEMKSAETVAQNVRTIGSQTFFFRNKQWVDSSVTPTQQKNLKKIKQFSDEYFQLIKDHGRSVAQYLVFDEAVLLNLDGQAYLIEPAK